MRDPARVTNWEMGLEAVVDSVLTAQRQNPSLAMRQRIGRAVADSIRAMPFAQRVVLERMLALRPPLGRRQRRGSWLLTTRVPGFTDVGHALRGLVSFHAWTEITDAHE
jgi:hypothetical protein